MADPKNDPKNDPKTSHIYVRNNEPRVHGLAYQGGCLALKPGVNRVERAEWDKVKDDEINKFRLRRGSLAPGQAIFEVLDGPEKKLGVALVADTFDRELLHSWLETERSPELVSAIQAQLARIAPAAANTAPIVEGMEPERAKGEAK